jgi:hypothetical protein
MSKNWNWRNKKKPVRHAVLAFYMFGAGERNRTTDRLITNQLLYLLSYTSYILTSSLASMPLQNTSPEHRPRHPVGSLLACKQPY